MDNVQSIINALPAINNSIFLHWLLPAITLYSTTKLAPKIVDGYFLCKDFNPKNISQVILPPELSIENENVIIEHESEKIKNHLINFVNVLKNNFNKEDLRNLYGNINNLIVNVQNTEKYGVKSKPFAYYTAEENKINASENCIDLSIYHELFHMSSSYKTKDAMYVGFSQIVYKNPPYSIADGLNEGYTELLTKRYFPDNNSSTSDKYEASFNYIVLTRFANLTEQIVGKDKMENLYLNCNLRGLIDELKKYSSEKEIMDFINKLDLLKKYKWLDKTSLNMQDKLILENILKSLNEFLFNIFSKKMVEDYNNRIIDGNMLNSCLTKFSNSMLIDFTMNDVRIKAFSIEHMSKIINQQFKNNNMNFELYANENKKLH